MATIRSYETKDGEKRWMIDYYVPKDIAGTDRPKKVVVRGFKKRKVAEDTLRERQNWLQDGTHDQKAQRKRYTFDELAKKYREIHKDQPAWEKSKRYMVKRLAEDFKGRPLMSITFLSLEEYKAQLKKTPIRVIQRKGKPDEHIYPTPATVNRYMATLRHMLGKAVSWNMLAKNPFEGQESLQDQEESRDRYLSEDEIQRFLEHCRVQHIRDFFIIAANTGMDKGEILNLKWEKIKEGVIYCAKVKTRPERYIPLPGDLQAHLLEIKQRKIVSEYVVVDSKGKRVGDIKRGFKTVCRRAGIHNFRIKDLRHTFASHFAMRTGDVKALQEILGHTTLRMTSRYTHLCQVHKAQQMQKMNGLTSKSRTLVELSDHSGIKKDLPKLAKSLELLGGADRDRTDDLLNAIQALSQLSYSPSHCKLSLYIKMPEKCQCDSC